ncbi:hypothetical protein EET67_05245 [Pseudaminobacter arsenicus]|uniref:Holin n=1 Tax=Borborobacter arsenicus TaxID=1851146 RepID=A0A432VA72_9HYPH|nr:hypothetical protein [Pseudaminobacter arsenicus]RUM99044.1 hypothetical protein EET67_05245 [Pseudaminobacter arsenicus]
MIPAILLDLAGSVAVPVIKSIFADKFGDGGKLAGEVVDVVAGKLGVPAAKIQDQPPEKVQEALVAADPIAADLLAQYVESQRLMNETIAGERDKGGPTWTWAWRPFGMWLFLALTAHYGVVVPLLNALLTSPLVLVLDIPTFVTLFITYTGLYMGGHTAKAAVDGWRASRK